MKEIKALPGLTKATITGRVQLIGSCAFARCPNSKQISLPSGVTSIGKEAFFKCKKLKQMIIPASVTSIGKSAFSQCNDLDEILVQADLNGTDLSEKVAEGLGSSWYIRELWQFKNGEKRRDPTETGKEYWVFKNAKEEKIDLKKDNWNFLGTQIPNGCFRGCVQLEKLDIPLGIISIGELACEGCLNLRSVVILSSVTSIGRKAFSHCESLTRVSISKGATSIESGAFANCKNLMFIRIPLSVTELKDRAFKDCSKLTLVEMPERFYDRFEAIFEGCENLKKELVIWIPDHTEKAQTELAGSIKPLKYDKFFLFNKLPESDEQSKEDKTAIEDREKQKHSLFREWKLKVI